MKNTPNPFLPCRFTASSNSMLPKALSFIVVISGLATSLHAASATWQTSPTSGNWVASGGENNWSTGIDTSPGSTSVLTNADTAQFLTSGTMAIDINSTTLNVKSVTFGNVASPSAFTIGSTVGNSLFLSNGGTISITNTRTTAGASETVNAPLVLQPASSATAGTYTISNTSALAGDILTIGGAISGGTTTQGIALTLTGASTTANTIGGAISDGVATLGISLSKTSTGTWGLTANNTYTGATNISGATTSSGVLSGTLTLRGADGAISNTSAINMGAGRLTLDNTTASGGPNNNRVNDSAAINVTAGPNVVNFSHNGAAATNYSESLGDLTVSGGDLAIPSSRAATSQTSTLTFSSFNRTGTSTMNFSGTELGNADARNKVILTGQGNTTFLGGWATYSGGGQFASYDTTRGVTGATITGLAGVTAAGSNSSLNYRSGGTATLSTASGAYSGNTLAFSGGATQSLDLNGSTFKLSGGGITTATDIYTTTLSNGTITTADTASPTTLFVHSRSSNGSVFTFNASIADPTGGGSLSLVKTGYSTLTLGGANTFTGTTSSNAGSITVNNALALQNSILDYNNQGGTLTLTNAGVNYSFGGLSGAQNLQISGGAIIGVTMGNSNGSTGTDASYSGNLNITNIATFTKTGTNTQTFTGTNTFINPITLAGGTLALGSSGALGTSALATISFTGGTLQHSAANTTDYSARIAAGISTGAVSIDTNGQSVTYANALTASQSGGLTKKGAGTLTLNGANAYTGDTTVDAGDLAVNGTSIPNAGKVVINSGTIALTGTEVVNSLYFGLTQQASGTWGALGNTGADHTDARFSGTGLLSVTTAPGGYASWIGGFTVVDSTPTGDSDKDSMNNLLEYVLNGNPEISDPVILPDLDASGLNFVFTFTRRVDSAGDTTQYFESSIDLSDWITKTPILIPSSVGVTGSVTVGSPTGTAPNQVQLITVSISKGIDTKLFGRLRVLQP